MVTVSTVNVFPVTLRLSVAPGISCAFPAAVGVGTGCVASTTTFPPVTSSAYACGEAKREYPPPKKEQ